MAGEGQRSAASRQGFQIIFRVLWWHVWGRNDTAADKGWSPLWVCPSKVKSMVCQTATSLVILCQNGWFRAVTSSTVTNMESKFHNEGRESGPSVLFNCKIEALISDFDFRKGSECHQISIPGLFKDVGLAICIWENEDGREERRFVYL